MLFQQVWPKVGVGFYKGDLHKGCILGRIERDLDPVLVNGMINLFQDQNVLIRVKVQNSYDWSGGIGRKGKCADINVSAPSPPVIINASSVSSDARKVNRSSPLPPFETAISLSCA